MNRLRDLRARAVKAVKAAWKEWEDPFSNPARFDESQAPLAPRSPKLTGKWAKFDLRNHEPYDG